MMQIADKINKIIRDLGLKEVGQLEQDLVFGDAGTKEVINFLRTHPVSKLKPYLSTKTISVSTKFSTSSCRMLPVKINCGY